MQEQDRLEYERWTQTKGGKVYAALYDLENAIDALTDVIKDPEAIKCLRDEVNHMGENRFRAAAHKFNDLLTNRFRATARELNDLLIKPK